MVVDGYTYILRYAGDNADLKEDQMTMGQVHLELNNRFKGRSKRIEEYRRKQYEKLMSSPQKRGGLLEPLLKYISDFYGSTSLVLQQVSEDGAVRTAFFSKDNSENIHHTIIECP